MDQQRQAGLTTIELTICILLAATLTVALLRFLVSGFPLSKVTYLQARSTETARLQLRRITKAIRQARLSETGAYAIAEALPQKLVFYSDVDGNGQAERLRYELVGTNLQRGVVHPSGTPLSYNLASEQTTTVTAHVENGLQPIFVYYDGDFPADPAPLDPVDVTEIKYIQFNLMLDVDPLVDPPPLTVESQVQVRNLKTNLSEETP
jgi:hypothetical protein